MLCLGASASSKTAKAFEDKAAGAAGAAKADEADKAAKALTFLTNKESFWKAKQLECFQVQLSELQRAVI